MIIVVKRSSEGGTRNHWWSRSLKGWLLNHWYHTELEEDLRVNY